MSAVHVGARAERARDADSIIGDRGDAAVATLRFSVVVPTFNRPEGLARCLRALAAQTLPADRFEIVVVDDGGSLPARRVIDGLGTVLPDALRLQLIEQRNAGPASARNAGARAARGSMIAFLDDDCAPNPDWLRELDAAALANPGHAVGGAVRNAVHGNRWSAASQELVTYLYEYFNTGVSTARFFVTANVAFPLSSFRETGGFDLSFPLAAAEDRDLCERWTERGHRMAYADRAIVHHHHSLSLRSFCRQHINYGRGAVHLYRARAQRGASGLRLEPLDFYTRLLLHPLRSAVSRPALTQSLLLLLSQVMYVAGFVWERGTSRRGGEPPAGGRTAPGETSFAMAGMLLFVASVVLTAVRHEPWPDEVHAWRMAIDSPGLRALVSNARYEGHPLLFHVALQLIGQLSREWWAAAAFHTLLACGSAWLVLRHAPLPRWERGMIVAGYYFVFEYAVVVRAYALGVFLALLACMLWASHRNRGWPVVLLLVLVANTSAVGFILAASLGMAFLYESVSVDAREVSARDGVLQGRGIVARLALLAIVAGACTALFLLQVLPPADAVFRSNGGIGVGLSKWMIANLGTLPAQAFIPVAPVVDGATRWGGWALAPGSRLQLAAVDLLSVAVGVAALATVVRRRAGLLLLGAAWSGYLLFYALFFAGSTRHHGHLVLAWVLARWLSEAGEPSAFPAVLSRVARAADRARAGLVFLLLAPLVAAGMQFARADIREPFSDARRVAALLRADSLRDVPVIAVSQWPATSVAGLLDRPVIIPGESRVSTFSIRSEPGSRDVALMVDSIAAPLVRRGCPMLLITDPSRELPPELARRASLITATPEGHVMTGGRLIVWLIPGVGGVACTTELE